MMNAMEYTGMDTLLAGSFRAAIYCRLSKDDDLDGTSASIENQRDMLEKFCQKQGWEVTAVYQDDGFTGLNMERPDLKRMLKAIERKQINLVITKDLSRLGRNYLQTGQLIEDFFPRNGVRYIAMNDGIDTMRDNNDIAPFKNILNEFYARDTSKKIRAVKQAKAQKGERVNGQVPYGYIADPNDRNHLLPDPETAHIVKQIFAMYVRGDRICEIQNWLREHEVLTVAELQYRRTGSHRHPRPHPNCIYNWPDKTLYDILARKEYLGHTITGKSYKVSYKSKKTKKNPEEKRYVR